MSVGSHLPVFLCVTYKHNIFGMQYPTKNHELCFGKAGIVQVPKRNLEKDQYFVSIKKHQYYVNTPIFYSFTECSKHFARSNSVCTCILGNNTQFLLPGTKIISTSSTLAFETNYTLCNMMFFFHHHALNGHVICF